MYLYDRTITYKQFIGKLYQIIIEYSIDLTFKLLSINTTLSVLKYTPNISIIYLLFISVSKVLGSLHDTWSFVLVIVKQQCFYYAQQKGKRKGTILQR